jgi:hypothetical protein
LKIKLALGLILALCASSAFAIDVTSSTTSYATNRDCFDNAAPCDQISNTFNGVVGGLPGSNFATATAPGGTGTAAINSGLGNMSFTGSSSSGPGLRNTSNDGAMAEYTYTGMSVASLTFTGTMSYSQTLPANSQYGGAAAFLDIFTLPGSSVEAGADATSNFTMIFGEGNSPGYVELGSVEFAGNTGTDSNDITISVTNLLNPGETFWAWALLQTPSTENGTTSAAFHTSFSGSAVSGLVAGTGVPAPGTTSLLALGFGALIAGFKRRKRLMA